MNRYALVKAGIDFNEGLRRFNNSKELYESFLLEFPKDQNYKGLCTALEQQDVQAAFQCAHSLKGVAGNLSLQKLHTALLPLVEELRAGSLANASELFLPVRENYAILSAVLTDQK